MKDYIEEIDNSRALPAVTLYTSREMLMIGLELVYTRKRIHNVKGDAGSSKTNVQRFKNHYRGNPVVVAKIWEDLQVTTIQRARIRVLKVVSFFEALNFLYWYKCECEREAVFDR